MSAMLDFIKKLKAEHKAGRRSYRGSNPGNGIEYNEIVPCYQVSKRIYSVDIARTPQIVNSLFERIDVHGQAWKANQMNPMVNYKAQLAKGRGR